MAIATAPQITLAEYLVQENQSATKTELIQGERFPMAGASINHNRIVGQLHAKLLLDLQRSNYEVLMSDMRVWLRESESYVYPDVLVIKGEPVFTDESQMAISNPCFIAEVLSPSTATYDKKAKFDLYKSLPNLEEYLIISQTKYQIELYRRLQTNQWLLTEFSDVNDLITLESVSIEIKLGDLYQRVSF